MGKSTCFKRSTLEPKDPSGSVKKITNKWFILRGLESKSK